MFRGRNTKILATLGPASSDRRMIEALVDQGVDAFRVNMSHGTKDDHAQRIALIREVETSRGSPVGILADLQGPKIRIGSFSEAAVLVETGSEFVLDDQNSPGNSHRVELPHPELFGAINVGDEILLNDGRVRLVAKEVSPGRIVCDVRVGGELSAAKGVNVPGTVLPIRAMTDKDRRDLDFALSSAVDWIGLSFVQTPEDVAEARKIIAGRAGLLAKIEKPSAIKWLEEITSLSDGIMVARGDLGVELPLELVPGLQKKIVAEARDQGKPVVVATQMLESMIESPTPTRAEVSDVATAVYDGADAVMLSAESAVGKFPREAVAMMDRIIRQAETEPTYRALRSSWRPEVENTTADAISAAAKQVAESIGAAAIVTYTTTGSTALRAARQRPTVPLIVITTRRGTGRRLALLSGAHSVHTSDTRDFDDMVEKACRIAVHDGIAVENDQLVITAGVPFGTPGATNILRVARVPRIKR
ncbi:MAG: pyruvate kinase [Proteobacteria bacterium]|nr:pyruvate kinase [Pseudomonadota bacterium]